MKKISIFLLSAAMLLSVANVVGQEEIVWQNNLGGQYGYNFYHGVTDVADGLVAVGYSNVFGNGDWENVTGKGDYDAIIVKYDNAGNVTWKKNFGGNGADYYFSTAPVENGIIAVGYSYSLSFNNGDWEGIIGKGGIDAIIVKYDNAGNIIWKKNFGGSGTDYFYSVAPVENGIIAVGSSDTFGNGDWEGVQGKGGMTDCIIVKFDLNGNVVWKKNFGGNGITDVFRGVITISDGILVTGYSSSFNSGDWEGITGKGDSDGIIVKFDFDGNVIWKKNFGGNLNDYFYSIIDASNGIIAAGSAVITNNYDWTGRLIRMDARRCYHSKIRQ